jgi:hypothetical protein
MPLRDHFRPPLDNVHSWEGFHGGWPMVIVQHLRKQLPPGYLAEPRVHLGSQIEVDITAFERTTPPPSATLSGSDGGVAVATWAPPRPNIDVETALPDFDEYAVQVYDVRRGRRLVAAVEIVSPANKDRPESRRVFVSKCAALLQKGVCVSLVDVVTVRQFNLYAELLEFVGQADPSLGAEPPNLYAVTCRWLEQGHRTRLQSWSYSLVLGQPLPTLPLWLQADLAVPLELERSYEQTCSDLAIS